MSYASANTNSAIIPNTVSTDSSKAREQRAKDRLHKAEAEGSQLWATTKEKFFQPAVFGGVFSVVNIGLLGGLGYLLYTEPQYRTDYKVLGGVAAGGLVILGIEGAVAESYLQTPEGQREKERAEQEGSKLYLQTKEIVLRPGVFGGILGVVNVGILGGLGYIGYTHWDEPAWDRRYVAGITAGTFALFAGQGALAEQYREKEYPKRKNY